MYCRYTIYWVTNVLSVPSIIYSPSDACPLLEFFLFYSAGRIPTCISSALLKTRNNSVCLAHCSNLKWWSNFLNCDLLLRIIQTNGVETRWPPLNIPFSSITGVFANMQLLLPVRLTASINQYAKIVEYAWIIKKRHRKIPKCEKNGILTTRWSKCLAVWVLHGVKNKDFRPAKITHKFQAAHKYIFLEKHNTIFSPAY